MFRDNENTSLHPQDGNSLAVLYNVTANASQNAAVSEGLTSFWTPIGPVSPELSDTIIPFVGGFEVGFCLSVGRAPDKISTIGPSTLRRWAGRTGARPPSTRVGLHAVHQYISAVHAFGGLHCQRIIGVCALSF